jgi:signal transduction histidine kinase
MRKYLTDEQEVALAEAYELGRTAIAKGVGVLDMAQVQQEALHVSLRSSADGKDLSRILKAAETLLLESLSPFEATHRGFREMNLELQMRNRELKAEIRERKKAETALRQSERHYQRLFHRAQSMQEILRNLSNRILSTQEEERKRISRELHDEVGQSLTAISVALAIFDRKAAGNADISSRKISETQKLLQDTMESVHRFAHELRPALLDECGLVPALRSYLKRFASRTGLDVHFREDPVAEQLGNDQKLVIFRIVQESLTNVSKHARATQVEVGISKVKSSVCLEVADNGVSFTAAKMNVARGKCRLGLLGMEERVRLVNGEFSVKPQPGEGTTVRIAIPLRPPEVPPPLLKAHTDHNRMKEFCSRSDFTP